jgi:hypothetical protein
MWGGGFFNRAKNFDEVQANASDATDIAQLYDSPGADAFEGYADRATMTYEDGGVVRADDYAAVLAYASDDGQTDTAQLHDTTLDLGTSYATWLRGYNTVARMYQVGTFYNRADDFDEVVATAAGCDDMARLYDATGPDAFEAYADQGTMTYADGRTIEANDFRWVCAYGSDDGETDAAQLHDTTADLGTSYATWFKANDSLAKMYAGLDFYVQVKRFDNITASAEGGDDTAKLWDSALDDVYSSRPDHSRMEYGDGTFVEALDFRYLYAYSRQGSDTATFHDETAGGTSYATRFQGRPTWAKLYTAELFSRTEGFAELRASLGGDDDLVYLFDDPARDDHLLVPFAGDADHDPAKAKFSSDRREIYIDDFALLYASTSQELNDEADIAPAHADEVILSGNWVIL